MEMREQGRESEQVKRNPKGEQTSAGAERKSGSREGTGSSGGGSRVRPGGAAPRRRGHRGNERGGWSENKERRRTRSVPPKAVQESNVGSDGESREANREPMRGESRPGTESSRTGRRGEEESKKASRLHGGEEKRRSRPENPRHEKRRREPQSIEEIRADLLRIEKEIFLEIAEFENIGLD